VFESRIIFGPRREEVRGRWEKYKIWGMMRRFIICASQKIQE
jgi:hypothetical protein